MTGFDAERVRSLTGKQREVFEKFLRRQGITAILPVPRVGPLPLSFAQRRLWFLSQLTPGSGFWNVAMAVRVRGGLDVGVLARALSVVVSRHETLRTVFSAPGGVPCAVIRPAGEVPVEVVDVADEAAALVLAGQEAAAGFDLERGPVLRARVLRLGADEQVLLLTVHHIATDGWSHGVLWGELSAAYGALLAGGEPELPALPVQYADFAVWQREYLSGAVLDGQLAYWRGRLDGLEPLELPLDRARPPVASPEGGAVQWRLPADLARAAREVGAREGATLYMTLLAAFAVVLSRYAGTEDVAVGSPVAGRSRSEVEGLIGFFVNLLVMRVDLAGDPSFRELVGRVRDSAVGAFAHQDLPFEYLVEKLTPERDLSRHPLVQVVFQLVNLPPPGPALLGDARTEPFESRTVFTRTDLEVHLTEDGDSVAGTVIYAKALFAAETIERLMHHFTVAARELLTVPDRPISRMQLLDEADREQMLVRWNDTAVEFDDISLPRMFRDQVARTPDAPAVIGNGEALSYAELDRESDGIARRLRASGLGPDDLVGLCLERGVRMIAGLVGILKAGAAYVAIDPSYPQDRIRYITGNAGLSSVVTQERYAEFFAGTVAHLVLLDRAPEEAGSETGLPLDVPLDPENLAYVVYTSGSTGEPKGIAMPARCVVNLLAWQKKAIPGGPAARTAQFTALTFDVSVQEVLSALLYGETLVVPTDEVRHDARAFAQWLDEHDIEQIFVPNLMIRALAEEAEAGGIGLRSLRHISQAGEPLSLGKSLRELCGARPGLRIHNHYGSTEIQVVTACSLPSLVSDWPEAAHLGWPVDNARAYVVDERLRPVPVGVPGELCFAGPGLARGYLGQSGLTATKFVPNPFGEPGSRMYRTGDLGRWRPDGSLELLGRLDHQVKIRGFRIELGEVEAVLARHEDVSRAVVASREDTPGVKRLVAYIIPAHGVDGGLDARLRAHLLTAVPDYMLPSAFVTLSSFPLTTTGKIDRRALPAPDPHSAPRLAGSDGSPVAEALSQVFADVLDREQVGVDDDFFALGGHSLLATRTTARIRDLLGAEVSVQALFQHRTPAGLAEVVTAEFLRGKGAPPLVPVPRDRPLPLSFTQQQLWRRDQDTPGDPSWNIPMAIRVRGCLDVQALGRALSLIVCRHESLRTVFPAAGKPESVLLPASDLVLEVADMPDEDAAMAAAAEEAVRPVDLAQGPLLRARVLRLDERDHMLLLTVHHIAFDAWSQGVLWRELSDAYAALLAGREPTLPDLPVQYGDFAVWQRAWLTGPALDEQLDYWRERLQDARPMPLPGARPEPSEACPPGALLEWRLPAPLVSEARRCGTENDTTLYMTLLAAFTAVLGQRAGVDDLTVGSPVAGRTRTQVEGLIGFFASFTPLRIDLSGDPSFRELLGVVRDSTVSAFAHQMLPWEYLAGHLGVDRTTPLVNVLFQLVNVELGGLVLPGAETSLFTAGQALAHWDLEVNLVQKSSDAGLTGYVVYRPALFDSATVERLMRDVSAFLHSALADPDALLSALLRSAA